MHFDIKEHTIFRTITGSHAYGMATKDSDVDVRGVAIAPLDVVIGFSHFTPKWSCLGKKFSGKTEFASSHYM